MTKYEEIIERADKAAKDEDIEEALRLYKEAIDMKPERVDAYYNMALLYHQQGQLDDAIANFEKAAELEPNDASVFNNLGVLYYSKELLEKAERSFKKAIEIEPDYADAFYGLGKAYQVQERFQEAIESFNKCLRIEPNHKKANENLEKCLSETGIHQAVVKKQKLNIGFVSYWFERGQAYVTKAIRKIVAEEYNTFIFARSGGTSDKPLLKTKGEWDVPNLTTHNEYKIPKKLLKKWIIDNKLDIVFFNEEYDFGLVEMAKNYGVKTMGIYYWELFNPEFVPACKAVYNKIICPTEACYKKFRSLGMDNIEYIKWGVDLNQFKPIDQPENEKVRFFHPAGWGGMHARRGTQFVIDAFQKMDNPNAELLIHIQSDSGVQENGNIKITHGTVSREKLIKMYQGSDVAVLPSKWEGLGLTFLEAMGCGLPIITVDAPPMNEFIKDGFNGFCCKVSERKQYPNVYVEGVHPDIEDMAEKMNELTERELLASMRENTIEYVKENWDWQANSKKIIEIIEELGRELKEENPKKTSLRCREDIYRNTVSHKQNIFIIGLRRSGTTIVWETFRQDKRFVCFDEPFNPHLRFHVESGIDHKKHTMREYLSRPHLIRSHWSSIQPYEECYPRFLGHQVKYLNELLKTSQNVCIDFVRCHSKIEHLRKIAPSALIIHLVRDPRAFVTSHLRPYGKWISPELPDKFFDYDSWFDFWEYQKLANILGVKGHAFEKLLQLWKYFTDIAEQQNPDLTIQFENFATNPEEVIRNIYDIMDIEYKPLDYSKVHLPNPPFRIDERRWNKAIEKYKLNREFVYDFAKCLPTKVL